MCLRSESSGLYFIGPLANPKYEPSLITMRCCFLRSRRTSPDTLNWSSFMVQIIISHLIGPLYFFPFLNKRTLQISCS